MRARTELSPTRSLRVVECLALAYKRTWKWNVSTSFINPLLFLLAMGVGLGSLVDDRGTIGALGGLDYLEFLAPGLLAATAMQVAAMESTFPIFGKIKWNPTYPAMLSTPLTVVDVVAGQLAWIGFRLLQTTVIFAAVMAAFGTFGSPWAVLTIPAATFTGLAFAAPIAAYSATRERDGSLPGILRFGIMPMFLFSGTFYPVSQLPAGLRPVAYLTPLWHGVELCRDLAIGDAGLVRSLGHVMYLALWVGLGSLLALKAFRRRLVV